MKKTVSDLFHFRFDLKAFGAVTSDLSENETQDNVSMHNFKNTLTAMVRQVGRGGNTQWQ